MDFGHRNRQRVTSLVVWRLLSLGKPLISSRTKRSEYHAGTEDING
jgi:hypothetical protein